jgi:hypothetical protein
MTVEDYVVSVQDARDHLGPSKQAEHIYEYVTDNLSGRTAIIEDRYIDRDYFIDYAGFYARSFGHVDRCTKRVHFFSESFDGDFFEDCLINNHKNILKDKNYLGFTVIKQFKDRFGKPYPCIGRTLLTPMPKLNGNDSNNCRYICSDYKPNVYGIPLIISGLPFQAQDHAVAACATTALWTACHQLNTLFGTPTLPPIEITKRAGLTIENNRNFPNHGLTLKQMFTFLNSIDLDFEYLNVTEMADNYESEAKNIVPEIIKSMCTLNIPLIAALKLTNHKVSPDYHAVVISGYGQDKLGKINRLFIHDDQIGPYSRVNDGSSDGSFLNWSNDWTENPQYGPYDEMNLDGILIPLYPKIRLSYKEIIKYVFGLKEDFPTVHFNLYITTVQKYKNKLIFENIENKIDILRKPMPRYMWVINVKYNNKNITDLLIDATSHIIRNRCTVKYK